MNATTSHADQRISLRDARKLFPKRDGKYPTLVSMYRWIHDRKRHVRLNAEYVAGRYWTTAEWVGEFIAAETQRKTRAVTIRPCIDDDAADEYLRRVHGF